MGIPNENAWVTFGVYLLIALFMWGVYEIRHKFRDMLTGLCVGLGMCTFIMPLFLGAVIGFNALFPEKYAGTWVGILVGVPCLFGMIALVVYTLITFCDVVLKYILRYSVRMWCIIMALPMIVILPMCIYNWLRGNGFHYAIMGDENWYVDGLDNAWSFVSEE